VFEAGDARPYVELLSCSWCDNGLLAKATKPNNLLASIKIKNHFNFKN
jgi:hypothetical protein